MSLDGHVFTKAIYKRLLLALGSKHLVDIDPSFETEIDHALRVRGRAIPEEYFADRIRAHQKIAMSEDNISPQRQIQERELSSIPLTEFLRQHDCARLFRTLSDNKYTDEELSTALTLACKRGDASAAVKLCAYCKNFIADPEVPSPIHWLIMFDAKDLEDLGLALVGRESQCAGPCQHLLNSQSSIGENVFVIADHCLDLFGTPLHWAVRTRNKTLIRLLCHLGADLNAQWKTNRPDIADIDKPILPHFRPLDLAVQYHLPEIIELLISLGAQWHGSSFGDPYSALHCIGETSMPFSRYIMHGDAYLDALDQTLAVILSHGHDINETDSFGYTALMLLLSDCSCETYIIEGLIKAGARADGSTFDMDVNAAVIIASSSLRQHNTGGLSLIIDDIPNINALDRMGRNALHYSAILGRTAIAMILCNHDSTDIDFKSSDGSTALHLASMFGNADVINTLIQKGADLEAVDKTGYTALWLAVFHKKKDAINILLHASADPAFKHSSCGNLLHAATANAKSEITIVSYLLQVYPEFRSISILDGINSAGWTPLHKAAYYGDHEAVQALLTHGAKSILDGGMKTPHDIARRQIKEIERGQIKPARPGYLSFIQRIWQRPRHVHQKFVAAWQEIEIEFKDHDATHQHLNADHDGIPCFNSRTWTNIICHECGGYIGNRHICIKASCQIANKDY